MTFEDAIGAENQFFNASKNQTNDLNWMNCQLE